ncbi:MAG TPA: histidine kinase, partial [Candidatus Hydrogenedentes bacterium]|nr:histidine kinase [Candidatus Hydrogenedentota bacterium]
FIELRIEDDGVGLSDAGTHEGMGLQTMSYRAHLMEGELTAASIETGGTRILCRVPRHLQPKSGFTKEQAAS